MIPVILESPYAARVATSVEDHERFARACMADCLQRGEAPLASHLLYTQPGVLNDTLPEEREKGIFAGYSWWSAAVKVVFYTDLGWSNGMLQANTRCAIQRKPYEERQLFTSEAERIAFFSKAEKSTAVD
jgi:hypothetical protein